MLNTDQTQDTRRRNYVAPTFDGPADAADARTLVRHLIAQRAADRATFGRAATPCTIIIAGHHDDRGNIR